MQTACPASFPAFVRQTRSAAAVHPGISSPGPDRMCPNQRPWPRKLSFSPLPGRVMLDKERCPVPGAATLRWPIRNQIFVPFVAVVLTAVVAMTKVPPTFWNLGGQGVGNCAST